MCLMTTTMLGLYITRQNSSLVLWHSATWWKLWAPTGRPGSPVSPFSPLSPATPCNKKCIFFAVQQDEIMDYSLTFAPATPSAPSNPIEPWDPYVGREGSELAGEEKKLIKSYKMWSEDLIVYLPWYLCLLLILAVLGHHGHPNNLTIMCCFCFSTRWRLTGLPSAPVAPNGPLSPGAPCET